MRRIDVCWPNLPAIREGTGQSIITAKVSTPGCPMASVERRPNLVINSNTNRQIIPSSASSEYMPRYSAQCPIIAEDRKSVVKGKRGEVRVDLGGRRIIKKKNKN